MRPRDSRTTRPANYQILPELSADDYAALKTDIEERGVQVPVEYDQDGNIIDGHHRVHICKELGIKEWPRIVRTYADDAARWTQARKLNIARRHLDTATKRALIEAELKDRPERSNNSIAQDLGVDDKTVGAVRGKLISNSEIPNKPDRKEASGRKARGRKPAERRVETDTKNPQQPSKEPRSRKQSRTDRWMEAAAEAGAALQTLRDIQEELESWRDNLPENLQSSALAEKLTTVCELNIEDALSTVQEAECVDLPLGFARD